MLHSLIRLVPLALVLAACVAGEPGPGSSGLSGTPGEFAAMRAPCIAQTARLTGLPQSRIPVADSLQTGGGPILILDAGGARHTCRSEPDGSVTVFSEYAN
ncbi:hypothetical protein [Mangrovicoccus ximenensis]|uniref:hypothetical protein n=1 Tax=Mangrovicoccus ximenensis TaxID=1911570 RepID=UPI000D373F3F|nr:hypothetical protein [Mangrovicoccus ximenensis]